MKKQILTAALVLGLATTLAGCGDDESTDAGNGSPSSSATTTSTDEAGSLRVTDPWVKAADSGMTAAFGVLTNTGDEPVVVTAASTTVNAMTELHETIQNDDGSMAMQPKEGGFTVPAGGTLELAPGGNHIMLMELTQKLEPGTDVEITLTLGDGSTAVVQATVKAFDGADEKYQEGSH
ncbi:copper chaperone PCu(A)C [Nocardioides dubius]|uniref:Copper chaperone PCu(A)C n=1 Tax=Nocardioides dubius TaxID=317019 RepID=A0ABN1TM93_9ACTN